MGTDNPVDSKANQKDFLLEDFRYLTESFWRNEQAGETRVNWFIGLVTAVAAGLIALATSDSAPQGWSCPDSVDGFEVGPAARARDAVC